MICLPPPFLREVKVIVFFSLKNSLLRSMFFLSIMTESGSISRENYWPTDFRVELRTLYFRLHFGHRKKNTVHFHSTIAYKYLESRVVFFKPLLSFPAMFIIWMKSVSELGSGCQSRNFFFSDQKLSKEDWGRFVR